MKIITINKKAFHNYEILYTMEAGIVLNGDEVQSIRAGNISLNEAFATIHEGELNLINCSISTYSHAYQKQDTSKKTRKLLLHKKEIMKLIGETSKKGLTIIPLKAYFNEKGLVKIEIGVAKHKNAISKKQEIKERDIKRETQREIKLKIK
ncbi:TPA: SsrA-binding protein [Candidatus Dependentiae bacterium]|nr:MAG: SsrA-binding protein [candidate division TM6 bacterium GW2011_GWE2_31_21]KKP53474.1 MAG: SsrA-binding protein [candidate division TM6 bacterium GW2011_GWF2_33_332]HBS48284.1 SsrA-binding protein [Candidatus Dependentiae bacterium]HBZ73711.1 SsrA-binding protein [Candidatus Dependentiae bacterium]